MLAGMHVALSVEPAGRIVRTTSPFVDGQTVTLEIRDTPYKG